MKKESWRTWGMRWYMNFFPCYRGTGGRVVCISGDWKFVRVRLPLNWRTRNYVGTIFGGSFYGAVDPMYMLMLLKILGPEYVVWDKSASIRFIKPGRTTLTADFNLSDEEIATIRTLVEEEGAIDRHYAIELVDANGLIHARVEKTLFIAKKRS